MDYMEQADSHALNTVLAHFKEVRTRANNLLVDIKKKKRYVYCSSEWPPEGTFHLHTMLAVEDKSVSKGVKTTRSSPLYSGSEGPSYQSIIVG